jgi:hypothetical protein
MRPYQLGIYVYANSSSQQQQSQLLLVQTSHPLAWLKVRCADMDAARHTAPCGIYAYVCRLMHA